MSKQLFDGSSGESDNEVTLGTNKNYAKTYNVLRKKELLQKFKDRGLDVSESDSSDESSSDEDEVIDQKFDEEFFKTLASLKSKDPKIYNKETRFFEGVEGPKSKYDDNSADEQQLDNAAASKSKKSKPVTLKDYERQIILENGGKFEDDSDDEHKDKQPPRSASPTLIEEEKQLKAEFQKVMNASEDEDDNDNDFGGIFTKRSKTKEQVDKEEADYAEWLAGKEQEIKPEVKETLEPLKNYWSSNKLPQSERFLRDFILSKGYANTKSSEIPTYDEIVGDEAPLSEDEQELEKQAEFEHKYNFRFEEPDSEFIQRFPRTIEHSVRQKDDKRKQKRLETKQRKQQEKEQKMKEIEMVKAMKRKEIEEKIEKLKLVTGNDELGFKDEELEDDFDPEAHDRRMQEIFNDAYYQVDEGEEKPECPSDIDELKIEDWDNYEPGNDDDNGYGDNDDYGHCEDEDFNMDCDYDPVKAKQQLQQELIENTKGRKGRKGRRNRFKEMIEQTKPAFNPEDEKSYEEYLDEYYKLDCEDIIGDVPCRFKYVETTPNDFGLTIEEILLAKNKELNQWASLKKAIQIRPDYMEKKDQRLYKMKAKNEELKRKIFKSLYGEGSDDENVANDEEAGKNNLLAGAETNTSTNENATQLNGDKKTKKRKKRKGNTTVNTTATERSSAIEPTEPPQAKKAKLCASSDSLPINQNEQSANANASVEKKKKRNKKKTNAATNSTTDANSNIASASKNEASNSNPNKLAAISTTTKPSSHATITKQNQNNPFKSKFNKTTTANSTSNKANQHNRNNNKNPFSKFQNNKFNKFNKKPSNNTNSTEAAGQSKISDDRLKAYGINPKKFHKKQKYGKKE